MGAVVVVAVIGLALVLLVIASSTAVETVTRTERRSFRCPVVDRAVTVDVVHEAWTGRAVDVTSCSAFELPAALACGKQCLELTDLRLLSTVPHR